MGQAVEGGAGEVEVALVDQRAHLGEEEGHQQAGTLSELRDTLLPRLIAGQLSLSNVEEFTKVEAVSE